MTKAVDVKEADEWAHRLAADLAAAGDLTDPAWRRAFEAVPRHRFVPHFATWRHDDVTRYTLVSSTDPAQRKQWLAAVYSDQTLIGTRGFDPH